MIITAKTTTFDQSLCSRWLPTHGADGNSLCEISSACFYIFSLILGRPILHWFFNFNSLTVGKCVVKSLSFRSFPQAKKAGGINLGRIVPFQACTYCEWGWGQSASATIFFSLKLTCGNCPTLFEFWRWFVAFIWQQKDLLYHF